MYIAKGFSIGTIATLLLNGVACFQNLYPRLVSGGWQPTNNHFELHRRTQTSLFTLKPMVESIVTSQKRRTVFVGGKGGVGKAM